MRKIVALTAGLLIATANAQTPSVDPDQAANRTTLQWPPGYIEPNTPGMKYVSPETPQGTGPYKAIMATDSGANEFVDPQTGSFYSTAGAYISASEDKGKTFGTVYEGKGT